MSPMRSIMVIKLSPLKTKCVVGGTFDWAEAPGLRVGWSVARRALASPPVKKVVPKAR